jgi:hypothetical protein
MWVAIHKCMKAMLGISLYGYLYSKKEKNCYVFLIVSYVFSSTESEKKKAEQVQPGSGGLGKVAQTIYTHVNKCKNGKIKRERKQ